MPTPAQSRAAAAHKAKRQEAGEKQITVWLSKLAFARLGWLTHLHGTQQKALEALLLDPATTVAPTPSKPVSAKPKAPAAPPKVYGHPKPTKGKK
jgi:hypothetical protein